MFITKDTSIFIKIPLGLNLIALLIMGVVYIPESIKFLLEKGQVAKAVNDITYILKINKASAQ